MRSLGGVLKTNDNLAAAFAEEAKAYFRYLACAQQAEKEGSKRIARLFRVLAEAEKIHALSYLAILNVTGDTEQNLSDAVDSESYELTQMYPAYLAQAEKDGQQRALVSFRTALKAERIHAALLTDALEKQGRERDVDFQICSSCGFISTQNVPEKCPVCASSKEKFIKVE